MKVNTQLLQEQASQLQEVEKQLYEMEERVRQIAKNLEQETIGEKLRALFHNNRISILKRRSEIGKMHSALSQITRLYESGEQRIVRVVQNESIRNPRRSIRMIPVITPIDDPFVGLMPLNWNAFESD